MERGKGSDRDSNCCDYKNTNDMTVFACFAYMNVVMYNMCQYANVYSFKIVILWSGEFDNANFYTNHDMTASFDLEGISFTKQPFLHINFYTSIQLVFTIIVVYHIFGCIMELSFRCIAHL